MMTEIILALIVGALLGFIYLKDKEHSRQINTLIKAVVSKSAQDFTNMTLSEQTRLNLEQEPPLGPVSDEFVALGGSDAVTFDRMIDEINNPTPVDKGTDTEE